MNDSVLKFIDSILDRRSNNRFASIQEDIFIKMVSEHINKLNILDQIKFDPKLIVFLFKTFNTGQVFGIKETGEDAIYEIKNDKCRFVFWLIENRTEYSIKIDNMYCYNYNNTYILPNTIYEFVQLCNALNVEIEIKDFPYQDN